MTGPHPAPASRCPRAAAERGGSDSGGSDSGGAGNGAGKARQRAPGGAAGGAAGGTAGEANDGRSVGPPATPPGRAPDRNGPAAGRSAGPPAVRRVRTSAPQRRRRLERRGVGAPPPPVRREGGQPGAGGVEQHVVHGRHPVEPEHVLRDLDQDRAARGQGQDPGHRRQRGEPHRGEEAQGREHQQVADDLARRVTGPMIVSRSPSGTRLTRPGTVPARLPGNMVIHTHGTVP